MLYDVYIVGVGWFPLDFEGYGHTFVSALDITERARDSMRQMMVKLTTKEEKYAELFTQTQKYMTYTEENHKLELVKIKTSRTHQVSGFNI